MGLAGGGPQFRPQAEGPRLRQILLGTRDQPVVGAEEDDCRRATGTDEPVGRDRRSKLLIDAGLALCCELFDMQGGVEENERIRTGRDCGVLSLRVEAIDEGRRGGKMPSGRAATTGNLVAAARSGSAAMADPPAHSRMATRIPTIRMLNRSTHDGPTTG